VTTDEPKPVVEEEIPDTTDNTTQETNNVNTPSAITNNSTSDTKESTNSLPINSQ